MKQENCEYEYLKDDIDTIRKKINTDKKYNTKIKTGKKTTNKIDVIKFDKEIANCCLQYGNKNSNSEDNSDNNTQDIINEKDPEKVNHENRLCDVKANILYHLENYYNILTASYSEEHIKDMSKTEKSNDVENGIEYFTPRSIHKTTYNDNSIGHNVSELDSLKNCISILKENHDVQCQNNHNETFSSMRILAAQELERSRIARDLHDTTVQTLTNLVHRSELCMKLIDTDSIRVKLDLQVMIQCLKEVINDMRCIIYNLRPMSMDDLGLEATLSRYVSKLQKATNIKISYKVSGSLDYLDSVMGLTIYRIIQEATNNSVKHSYASKIEISIITNSDTCEISIIDNGKGFYIDENLKDNTNNFGLSIMRERVYLLNGKINIISKCNEGTQVFVSLPLV